MKPGDVVRLKSGGPFMTVSSIESETAVWCEWFAGDEPKGGRFAIACLEPKKPATARIPL